MQEKQNVVLDSCTLFLGLGAFSELKDKGISGLSDYIKDKNKKLEEIKKDIEEIIPLEIQEKANGLSFEDEIDKYKEVISTEKSNSANNLRKAEEIITGKRVLKDGTIVDFPQDKYGNRVIFPKEKIDKAIISRQEAKENLEFYNQIEPTFLKLREEYKDLYQIYWASKIVEMYAEGKINLFLVTTGYDEIIYHTKGLTDKQEDENFKLFDQDKIIKALECCSLISFRTDEIAHLVGKLAYKYRNSFGKYKAMDEDQNSRSEYGDSSIMAEANLAGMTLITLNVKDFIKDASMQAGNDFIRKHISLVNQQHPDVATDALPVSPQEFVEGRYTQPTMKSQAIKYVPVLDNYYASQEGPTLSNF